MYYTRPNKKDGTSLNDTWCKYKMDETEDDLIMFEYILAKLFSSISNTCVSKKYQEGNGFDQNGGKKKDNAKRNISVVCWLLRIYLSLSYHFVELIIKG